uniref:glycosyltransferase n=1 Tax=Thaumasiovibrio occultus TaxID=1891184 RepID=UPI000B35D49C|nr:glycosyltransferase [Thaumasiovibrio occultus]
MSSAFNQAQNNLKQSSETSSFGQNGGNGLNIVTITTLFPNKNAPNHGIFIKNRMKHYLRDFPESRLTVIAPVPYFPSAHPKFGRYARFANVPAKEEIDGITIYHPKYLVVPKLGMRLTPFTLAGAIRRQLSKLINQGQTFDLIDGHYFFPDGRALSMIAKQFDLPLTLSARGTDISTIPHLPAMAPVIRQVISQTDHAIAVCDALRNDLIALGAPPENVTTLRNGIDLDTFGFSDQTQKNALRQALGVDHFEHVLITVARLEPHKGQQLIIDTLPDLPNTALLVLGDGSAKNDFIQQAQRLGVAERVKFVGNVPHQSLAQYYGAADCSVLASSREGWANVLLESMACGTPVVATPVGGTPEVIRDAAIGELVERDVDAITTGIQRQLAKATPREQVRAYAHAFGWRETSIGLHKIFSTLAGKPFDAVSHASTIEENV